jgi:hypothetical protein
MWIIINGDIFVGFDILFIWAKLEMENGNYKLTKPFVIQVCISCSAVQVSETKE